MKTRIIGVLIAVLCIALLSGFAVAVPVDITNGGMEITGPDTMTQHNVLAGGSYYEVDFKWNPKKNLWDAIGYRLEDPTFSSTEYYPLRDGSTWTYLMSGGGTLTLTVNGTEDICGTPSVRLDASDGSRTYWINDADGVFMSKYVFPDGIYNEWCPPMKISAAQTYLGSQTLNSFYGAILGSPYGVFGTADGWTQYAVKALEDVTVPAGTFLDCFRATFVFSYQQMTGGNFSGFRIEETWYAKDVGIVKRVNTETTWVDGVLADHSAETYVLQSYSIPE